MTNRDEIWRRSLNYDKNQMDPEYGIPVARSEAIDKVKELIPGASISVMKRVAGLIYDIQHGLEDISNKEHVINDCHRTPETFLVETLTELQEVWNLIYLARVNDMEEDIIYGPVFPKKDSKNEC